MDAVILEMEEKTHDEGEESVQLANTSQFTQWWSERSIT